MHGVEVMVESAEDDDWFFIVQILQNVGQRILLGRVDLQQLSFVSGLNVPVLSRPSRPDLLQPQEPCERVARRHRAVGHPDDELALEHLIEFLCVG